MKLNKSITCTLVGVVTQLVCIQVYACSVSATSLQFGSINPIDSVSYNSQASVTVTCPSPTSFSTSLSPGAGSYSERTMVSGSEILKYNIFLDSGLTQVWGDGTSATVTWDGTADSTGSIRTVYGHLPHQPSAYPGVYSDTITVTVTF